MDTLRGNFGSGDHDDRHEFGEGDEFDTAMHGVTESGDDVRDHPPAGIGQDERRMQVRAYNHWAGLLDDRTFPSIEDLEPESLPDFGPHSVLLDFSAGIEDPIVQYLGDKLADECGAPQPIERLSDVPPRSLLSRITDHYMQIMANQAPIGFEAEFVNQRGYSVLYRGILLPFSSDDETIDFIYGVINWKEMADAATADELLLEIDQALETDADTPVAATARRDEPIADWADSPAHENSEADMPALITPAADIFDDNIADFGPYGEPGDLSRRDELPAPDFGQYTLDDPDEEEDEYGEYGDETASYNFASLSDYIEAPAKKAVDLDADEFDPADYQIEEPALARRPAARIPTAYEPGTAAPTGPDPAKTAQAREMAEEHATPEPVSKLAAGFADQVYANVDDDADLHDHLEAARALARNARASEDRSRHALYAAVGRAYDFSLAAKDAPEEYDALIEESGLTVQERAPMTPVVKLVFGSDYDKTRLTEYAAVLSHAHRLDVARGALADFLIHADGGLKGVVAAERRLRRLESGKTVEAENTIREALAQKLRELEAMILEAEGPEFSLVMVRRDAEGDIEVIGEVSDDIALMERAARLILS